MLRGIVELEEARVKYQTHQLAQRVTADNLRYFGFNAIDSNGQPIAPLHPLLACFPLMMLITEQAWYKVIKKRV